MPLARIRGCSSTEAGQASPGAGGKPELHVLVGLTVPTAIREAET